MLNGLSFDIEWHFPLDQFLEKRPAKELRRVGEDQIVKGTERLLNILRRYSTKATFFVVANVVEYFPNVVGNIISEGHEIACHGYRHTEVWRQSPKEFKKQTISAKEMLQETSHQRVNGYRAPCFSINRQSVWALPILKDVGFAYDSSILAGEISQMINLVGLKNGIYSFDHDLIELPVDSISLLGRNHAVVGGGFFRVLPYSVTKRLIKRRNQAGHPVYFFLHQWELDVNQPRLLPRKQWGRCYAGIRFAEEKLKRILGDFSFATMSSVIKEKLKGIGIETGYLE